MKFSELSDQHKKMVIFSWFIFSLLTVGFIAWTLICAYAMLNSQFLLTDVFFGGIFLFSAWQVKKNIDKLVVLYKYRDNYEMVSKVLEILDREEDK